MEDTPIRGGSLNRPELLSTTSTLVVPDLLRLLLTDITAKVHKGDAVHLKNHCFNILLIIKHEEDSRFLTVNVRKLSMCDLMYIQVAHTLKFYNPMPVQSTVVIHELAEAVSPDSV